MACIRGNEVVKVVLIETQYVETDPMSFKSVVQNLTGKDSCVAIRGEKRKRRPVAVTVATASGSAGGGSKNVSMLTKGMSFKDLDKLIMEAPSMEDLLWLWADHHE